MKSLRKWFIIHFIVDIAVAFPLFFIPETALSYLGFGTVDPIATRLVAAALFAIGIESYLGRNSGIEAFLSILNLKIIWSTAAILGILLSIIQGLESNNLFLWFILVIFILFNLVWILFRNKLKTIEIKT